MSDTRHPPASATFSPQAAKIVDDILATRMAPGEFAEHWVSGATEDAMAARLANLAPASDLITKTLAAILARRPDLVGQPIARGWRAAHEYDPTYMLDADTVLVFCIAAVGKVPVFVMHVGLYEKSLEESLDDAFEDLGD